MVVETWAWLMLRMVHSIGKESWFLIWFLYVLYDFICGLYVFYMFLYVFLTVDKHEWSVFFVLKNPWSWGNRG